MIERIPSPLRARSGTSARGRFHVCAGRSGHLWCRKFVRRADPTD